MEEITANFAVYNIIYGKEYFIKYFINYYEADSYCMKNIKYKKYKMQMWHISKYLDAAILLITYIPRFNYDKEL